MSRLFSLQYWSCATAAIAVALAIVMLGLTLMALSTNTNTANTEKTGPAASILTTKNFLVAISSSFDMTIMNKSDKSMS